MLSDTIVIEAAEQLAGQLTPLCEKIVSCLPESTRYDVPALVREYAHRHWKDIIELDLVPADEESGTAFERYATEMNAMMCRQVQQSVPEYVLSMLAVSSDMDLLDIALAKIFMSLSDIDAGRRTAWDANEIYAQVSEIEQLYDKLPDYSQRLAQFAVMRGVEVLSYAYRSLVEHPDEYLDTIHSLAQISRRPTCWGFITDL